MTPLETLIRAQIAETGPVTVAEFMSLALGHPQHGYYMKGDPFGIDGDFVTSPEIGQVFGELIGLWAAVAWQQMGSPGRTILIECGPGRGTLMQDLLRAANTVPAFANSIDLHLVETSAAMRERQKAALSGANPTWHCTLDAVPTGPTIVIANEFIDALPIRQFVRTGNGWTERCVTETSGALAFTEIEADSKATDLLPETANSSAPGTVYEICPGARTFVEQLGARYSTGRGAALVVDYGYAGPAAGDTLQAVRNHAFAPPLSDPGDCDLTAHVDFGGLSRYARENGCRAFGPVTQSDFLTALGILERTDALTGSGTPQQARTLRGATERLIDPGGMGTLFKAMAITDRHMEPPAAFETFAKHETEQR